MARLFLTVVNMSITSSYIIFAVMLVRLLLRKAPKKYSYMLWLAVAFRLCVPVSFSSLFSVFNLPLFDMKQAQSAASGALTYIPDASAQMPPSTGLVQGDLPFTEVSGENDREALLTVLAAIWGIILLQIVLYAVFSYINAKRSMSEAVLFEKNIYCSERIKQPFVLGFIRAKIYIPLGLEEKEREFIIAHEAFHIKRGDHIAKLFAFALLAVHWFNPLCWVAFILMTRDMEMSCDEHVILQFKESRKLYSRAILSFAAEKRPPFITPLAFGETSAKSRIKNVLSFKKQGPYIGVACMILAFFAIFFFAANPKEASFDGIYRIGEIVYENESLASDAMPYAVEITAEGEITVLSNIEGEISIDERKGLAENTKLNEYNFDYYFPIEQEEFARNMRKYTVDSIVAEYDCYALKHGNGKRYFIKLCSTNGGLAVSYIAELSRIGDCKYTDMRLEDDALIDFDFAMIHYGIPLKFETDFDKIEIRCENKAYIMADGKNRAKAAVPGNETVYLYHDYSSYTTRGTVLKMYFYRGGNLAAEAEITYEDLKFFADYTGEIEFYKSFYSGKNMFVIRSQ